MCGGSATLVKELRTLTMGERPVTFMDQFYRCRQCEEEFLELGKLDESLRRATAVIRAEDGLLAPDEIVDLRHKYGLTQSALERLIGAGEKTVVRWERGTVSQNKTADTLLRVLREFPDVVAHLAKQGRRPSKVRPPAKRAPRKVRSA
jgi:HTH-type transcriptional regulator / antitoxin MqsA